jgi:predicted restriction endonuclease
MDKPTRIVDPNFRSSLLERDGRCLVCGTLLDENTIHPHHISTRGSGGDDVLENGISLCRWCHDDVHRGHTVIEGERVYLSRSVLCWLLMLNHGYEYTDLDECDRVIAELLFQRYTFNSEAWFC